MCDDHAPAEAPGGRPLTRRAVLQGLVGLAGLAGLAASGPAAGRATVDAPRQLLPAVAGEPVPYRLAMHLHASASEGAGSVRSHLAEAAANGFDVAWFTEHDLLRRAMWRRSSYHFQPDDVAFAGSWRLPALPPLGSLGTGSGGQLVSTPVSPGDGASLKGSLRLTAVSAGAEVATVGHRIDSESASHLNLRGRILGRTVVVDVLPTSTGPNSWGEIRAVLSYHPASGDRPAGVVSLSYRLRSDVTHRAVSRSGATGIVDLPVSNGRWQTVRLELSLDVQTVWPDMQASDNSLCELEFHASSRRMAPAELFFSFLRFDEARFDGVGVEHALVAAYADEEPGVLGLIGTEYSLGPHVNQYGGTQDAYDYGAADGLDHRTGEIRRSLVDFIHRHGGLASINHPFLPSEPWTATSPSGVAHDLLSIAAGGADILEVGYGSTQWVPAHFAVWDTMSRNALFLTGNGVTDDHTGQGWATRADGRFFTSAWTRSVTEGSLLAALSRGRAFVGHLGSFGGTIDMTMDDVVPMGAVSVDPAISRTLRLDVTGLPPDAAVEVVRGDVDLAGIKDPNPNTTVVARLGPTDLASRSEITVDTTDDSFVRLHVVDVNGGVIAFGQPIWTLKAKPPTGIPPSRLMRR